MNFHDHGRVRLFMCQAWEAVQSICGDNKKTLSMNTECHLVFFCFLYFAEAEEDELNDAKQELKHELNLEKCDRAHHWIGDGYCDDDTNIEG